MRKYFGVGMIFLGLGLVLPRVHAQLPQQKQAGSFFTGVNPRNIQFKTIDVSRAAKPNSLNDNFHKNVQKQPTGLSRLFPKISLGTWPPKVPNVPLIAKGKNPFQPNPIRGRNPFDPPAKK